MCEREYHIGCLRAHKKMDLKVCFHFEGIRTGITNSDVKWIVFLGKDISNDNNSIPKNIFVRKKRKWCFMVELLFKMVLFQGGVT
uniref:Uncharacterized protein n=1 Tax=Lactuca sativa TaxID=4236 RepID=A0A9R1WQQ0_LACSA|nr:hypothetical protein LSAT_V11C100039890 [Lactuca sativa]